MTSWKVTCGRPLAPIATEAELAVTEASTVVMVAVLQAGSSQWATMRSLLV